MKASIHKKRECGNCSDVLYVNVVMCTSIYAACLCIQVYQLKKGKLCTGVSQLEAVFDCALVLQCHFTTK